MRRKGTQAVVAKFVSGDVVLFLLSSFRSGGSGSFAANSLIGASFEEDEAFARDDES